RGGREPAPIPKSDQVFYLQRCRPAFPGRFELGFYEASVIRTVLRLERLLQAPKRPRVAGIAFQISTENLLRTGGVVAHQEHPSERLAHREEPVRWFAILERVLHCDGGCQQ